MIVCGEKCARTCLRLFVKILHNGPRNADTIVGTCASSQLIEQHKTLWRHVVKDVRSLSHLDHERGFAQRNVVAGSYAREYFVHKSDVCPLSRNETTHLGKQNNEGCLAKQRRFSGHIRPRYHHHLLLFRVKIDVIGHVTLAQRQLGFNHRMATLADIYHLAVVYDRSDITVIFRRFGETQQTIDACQQVCIDLNLWNEVLHG